MHLEFFLGYSARPYRRTDGEITFVLPAGGSRSADSQGVAVEELENPGPIVSMTALETPKLKSHQITRYIGCSQSYFCTADILTRGVVADNVCWPKGKPGPPPPQAKPGEIVVYAKKYGRWMDALDGMFGAAPFNKQQRDEIDRVNDATLKKCPIPGVPSPH